MVKQKDFFKGIIDEVRIYNRPLTEDEVIKKFQIQKRVCI